MVTALVLLSVEHDKTNIVAEKITAIPGVTEVYSVAGRYDLAVIIRVKKRMINWLRSSQIRSGKLTG